MAQILYLKASPRVGRSHSVAVADSFVAAYQELHPGDPVEVLDLFQAELPAFDGLLVNAKYNILHGRPHSPEEAGAWRRVEELIGQFKAADKYVLATPMWNFSIPYRLKQYLDIIVQPTYTFSYAPDTGYRGLVTGKPIMLVCARGGAYPEGTLAAAYDLQTAYLKLILQFIGFTDLRWLLIEPTLEQGPEMAQEKRRQAMARARELAREF
ncbi:MAG: NAD(P)H-dependent oxidoreductase [Syntrophobacterales bacterium]|nr:NAD(P)H-dependent oxidoreductase [Syntrophobacterales bacterium]